MNKCKELYEINVIIEMEIRSQALNVIYGKTIPSSSVLPKPLLEMFDVTTTQPC